MLRRTPATAHSIVERNQALLLRNVALELHEIKILETIKGKIHADGAINFNDFQACQAFLSSRGRETFLRDPARFIEAQKKVADLVRNAKLGSQTSPKPIQAPNPDIDHVVYRSNHTSLPSPLLQNSASFSTTSEDDAASSNTGSPSPASIVTNNLAIHPVTAILNAPNDHQANSMHDDTCNPGSPAADVIEAANFGLDRVRVASFVQEDKNATVSEHDHTSSDDTSSDDGKSVSSVADSGDFRRTEVNVALKVHEDLTTDENSQDAVADPVDGAANVAADVATDHSKVLSFKDTHNSAACDRETDNVHLVAGPEDDTVSVNTAPAARRAAILRCIEHGSLELVETWTTMAVKIGDTTGTILYNILKIALKPFKIARALLMTVPNFFWVILMSVMLSLTAIFMIANVVNLAYLIAKDTTQKIMLWSICNVGVSAYGFRANLFGQAAMCQRHLREMTPPVEGFTVKEVLSNVSAEVVAIQADTHDEKTIVEALHAWNFATSTFASELTASSLPDDIKEPMLDAMEGLGATHDVAVDRLLRHFASTHYTANTLARHQKSAKKWIHRINSSKKNLDGTWLGLLADDSSWVSQYLYVPASVRQALQTTTSRNALAAILAVLEDLVVETIENIRQQAEDVQELITEFQVILKTMSNIEGQMLACKNRSDALVEATPILQRWLSKMGVGGSREFALSLKHAELLERALRLFENRRDYFGKKLELLKSQSRRLWAVRRQITVFRTHISSGFFLANHDTDTINRLLEKLMDSFEAVDESISELVETKLQTAIISNLALNNAQRTHVFLNAYQDGQAGCQASLVIWPRLSLGWRTDLLRNARKEITFARMSFVEGYGAYLKADKTTLIQHARSCASEIADKLSSMFTAGRTNPVIRLRDLFQQRYLFHEATVNFQIKDGKPDDLIK